MKTHMFALLLAAATATGPPAMAEEDPEISRAKLLIDVSTEAFRAKKFAQALEGFTQAAEVLSDRPRLHWNIGRCQELLGQTEVAINSFKRYVQLESRDRNGIQEALDKIAELRSRQRPEVATVRVETKPRMARVWLDGKEVGESPVVLEVGAGEHHVRAEVPRHGAASATFNATAGEGSVVSLTLAPPGELSVPPPPPSTSRWVFAGWSLATVSAAAISTGFFLDWVDAKDRSELTDRQLASATISPAIGAQRKEQAGDDAQRAAVIALSVLSVAVVSGTMAILNLWASDAEDAPAEP